MLSLLLHMHQPDYRDPSTGEPSMPWVRLHATRGYTDVPAIVRETGARVTLNLVPSLLDQWDHYARGGLDPHLRLSRRPADSLEPHERDWVLQNFFAGNPGAYTWFPAWGELRARRDAGHAFSAQDLRDVQVWSNLMWFGFTALRAFPLLGELRRKGRGFTEAEKSAVLDAQAAVVGGLAARWVDLPEVSCTPYYHPILPLLVDTAHAARCMPGVPDPGFRRPEDARRQIVTGRARVEAFAGRPVRGMWPSEGSVSPEVLELAAAAGLRWVATDEGVLARSSWEERGAGHRGPPREHHGPWEACEGRLRLLFRDRGLSDRLGFVYATWPGERAAADLLAQLPDAPILLALDGENPWEAYPDAGEAFLRALLGRARTATCGEMAEEPTRGRVTRIHTGSWIDADFRIWIGHEEDRAAWTLLAEARQALEERRSALSAHEASSAERHLLAAEGSDWFWWYGDDFSTPFAGEFDRLFRAHVSAAWRALSLEPPEALRRPIKRAPPAGTTPPLGPLPARDDGSWFAWAPAGRVDLRAGAMAPVKGAPRALLFGSRDGRLALRALGGGEGWSVASGSLCVPLVHGRAELPADTECVALVSPEGQRVPDVDGLRLPWRAWLPARPC
jgi:alpha-amylase/alpha-mannosidase (GH57 family)